VTNSFLHKLSNSLNRPLDLKLSKGPADDQSTQGQKAYRGDEGWPASRLVLLDPRTSRLLTIARRQIKPAILD
jgi:hypothetical protein